MKMQKVCVGMPVYNSEKYIEKAIKSLLNQSYEDFELIICDNASTDNTREICLDFASKDPRIRFYENEENIGANPNYNKVFNLSNAEYFKWASSNDVIDKHVLQQCVEVLDNRSDVVLCYPKTKIIDEQDNVVQSYDDNSNLMHLHPNKRFIEFLDKIKLNNIMNGMIRSKVLRKTELIKNYYSSDIVLMAELSLYGKFVEIEGVYFYRRIEPETSTMLKNETELLRHYDPKLKQKMLFQLWIRYYNYFRIVNRTKIKFLPKSKIYAHLVRRMFGSARSQLIDEIFTAMKKTLT